MAHANAREKLEAVLLGIPPARLLALELLREAPTSGEWFPAGVDPEQAARATVELIDYTRACQSARARLSGLGPVALESPVAEFPL